MRFVVSKVNTSVDRGVRAGESAAGGPATQAQGCDAPLPHFIPTLFGAGSGVPPAAPGRAAAPSRGRRAGGRRTPPPGDPGGGAFPYSVPASYEFVWVLIRSAIRFSSRPVLAQFTTAPLTARFTADAPMRVCTSVPPFGVGAKVVRTDMVTR